jgi:hypothetical protein
VRLYTEGTEAAQQLHGTFAARNHPNTESPTEHRNQYI